MVIGLFCVDPRVPCWIFLIAFFFFYFILIFKRRLVYKEEISELETKIGSAFVAVAIISITI